MNLRQKKKRFKRVYGENPPKWMLLDRFAVTEKAFREMQKKIKHEWNMSQRTRNIVTCTKVLMKNRAKRIRYRRSRR
ncbi:MAG: hypothetical protein Q4B26_04790 [Eubacteriales bacterium]|nr:hypothetical protein [Eubacteriales bacterium]